MYRGINTLAFTNAARTDMGLEVLDAIGPWLGTDERVCGSALSIIIMFEFRISMSLYFAELHKASLRETIIPCSL